LNDKVYAIGGGTASVPFFIGTIFNTNEVYDPATNIWTTLAPLPQGVTGNTATIGYNGKIYVMGGLNASGVTGSVQIYDVATDTWSTGAPVPTPRYNAMTGILSGQIVVFGGGGPVGFNPSGGIGVTSLLSRTEIYDPASNTWTIGPAMQAFSEEAGQGVTFNSTQIFSVSNIFLSGNATFASRVQVLDTSTDPQPTISSISQTAGAQGATINATISGTNLTGATSIVFTGTGVSATILSGGTATSVPVQITIGNGAATGLRQLSVNTPTGTTTLFSGFTVTSP
jgi:N-acetylneuraminic acid mutarotase